MQKSCISQKGFTLVEMLLSVATMAIVAGLSIPVYQSFQVRNDLDIAAITIVQNLRRAQTLSGASDGDTTWGLSIQTGAITLFKGVSYVARDVTYDESFYLPLSITPSGSTEIVFAKLSGLPQTTGTITLASNTNETRNITLNSKGMVSY